MLEYNIIILIFTGKHCCSICDLQFNFKSQLERHFLSVNHVMFAESVQQARAVEAYDSDGSIDNEEVC